MPTHDIPENILISYEEQFGSHSDHYERERWFSRLEDAFYMYPKIFREDHMKLRGALRGLDDDGRIRWQEHTEELLALGSTQYASWDYFVEWTFSLLPISYVEFQFLNRLEYERATMRPNEDPWKFRQRLEKLERHINWDPEMEEAARFCTKLDDRVLRDIYLNIRPLPWTREQWCHAVLFVWPMSQSERDKMRVFDDRVASELQQLQNQLQNAPSKSRPKKKKNNRGRSKNQQIPEGS